MSDLEERDIESSQDSRLQGKSTISSVSMSSLVSRNLVQKAISINPTVWANAAKPHSSSTYSEAGVETPPIENKSTTGKLLSPRRLDNYANANQAEIIKDDTQQASFGQNLRAKFNQIVQVAGNVFSDPITTFKVAFASTQSTSINFVNQVIQFLISIPANICSAIKSAIEYVEDLVKADSSRDAPTVVEPAKSEGPSEFNWLFFWKPTPEAASSKLQDFSGAGSKDEIEELFKDNNIKKSTFQILSESIQQLVDAIYEKIKEKEEYQKTHELEERKEKLEEDAKHRLAEAQSLRPDLADELELPDTEFMLGSSFNDIPNVDALIEQAAKRKMLKSST